MPVKSTASRKRTPKASVETETIPARPSQCFIRNLRHTRVRCRLDPDFVIELEPRGQREDVLAIKKEHLENSIFMLNKDLLFEIIDPEEAASIITKQMHNMQIPYEHPAMKVIRDENDKPMERKTLSERHARQNQMPLHHIDDRGNVYPRQSQPSAPFGSPRMLTSEAEAMGLTPKRRPVAPMQDAVSVPPPSFD